MSNRTITGKRCVEPGRRERRATLGGVCITDPQAVCGPTGSIRSVVSFLSEDGRIHRAYAEDLIIETKDNRKEFNEYWEKINAKD